MSETTPQSNSSSSPSEGSPGVRWWPAIVILVLAAATTVYIWMTGANDAQSNVLRTMAVLFLSGFLLGIWLLFLSRLPWRRRFGILGILIAAAVLFFGLFRIEGVSGNFVPILAFRFADPLEVEAGKGTAEAVAVSPYDFPQFLGPDRDGHIRTVSLARDWATTPPKEVWRREMGDAWSGFAVVGEAALTLEQRTDPNSGTVKEVVVRYDKGTGDVVWTHAAEGQFDSVIGGNGPRSTPTVVDGRVFTFGSQGLLRCLDLASGQEIWVRDLAQEYGVKPPEWGFSSSPLIIGPPHAAETLVVVSPGGEGHSLVAHRASTGEPVWAAGDDRPGYSSPTLHEIDGVPQIVLLNGTSFSSHDPADGRLLWSHEWPGDQPNVAQPLVLEGNKVLVSSGYGVGAGLYEIRRQGGSEAATAGDAAGDTEIGSEEAADEGANEGSGDAAETSEATGGEAAGDEMAEGETDEAAPAAVADTWTVTELWRSPRMKAKFTNIVVHDGHLYGLDDGVLACVDPQTGDRCWKRGRYGHGQILLVGDLLLVQTESGEIVLLEPNPEEHRELGRIEALDGKSWNSLTLSGPHLLVRNADEAVCYELPLAS